MKLYDVIRKEQLEKESIEPIPEKPEKEEIRHIPPRPKHAYLKKILTLAAALMFLVALYVLGMKFVKASVRVVERKIPFSLDGATIELTHEKIAENGRLSFQAMVVQTEITREVYGSVAKASMSKAKGSMVLFNEFSTSAQTIKSGTTVTGANGKKYITQAQATIPGFTTVAKVKKAGTSAAVPIIAADTGASFNTEGTTFTISGYSGAKAKQIYGRSAGAITGGEIGAVHAVSDTDKDEVMRTLEAQLTERLKRETRAQIPNNLVTFPDLQFVTFTDTTNTFEGSSIKFPVKVKGSMVSYLIPRDLLEASIAKKAINNYNYPHVSIPSLSDLVIEPVTAIPTNVSSIPDTITLSISGSGTIITKVPVEEVKEKLVGIPRTAFSDALSSIAEVDNARFSLMPFWAPFFPASTADISVKVE